MVRGRVCVQPLLWGSAYALSLQEGGFCCPFKWPASLCPVEGWSLCFQPASILGSEKALECDQPPGEPGSMVPMGPPSRWPSLDPEVPAHPHFRSSNHSEVTPRHSSKGGPSAGSGGAPAGQHRGSSALGTAHVPGGPVTTSGQRVGGVDGVGPCSLHRMGTAADRQVTV